jgi:hypothetical protein
MDAHAQTPFREAQRRRAPGHAAADDRDVDTAVVAAIRTRRNGIFEPVRIQDVER